MVFTQHFDHHFRRGAADLSRQFGRRKLMVVLHGRGDSYEPFLDFPSELGLEEFDYLFLNAPRKYDEGYTWYAFPPNQGRGVRRARDRFLKLLNELDHQGYRSEDVFFLGFSQGALVSLDLLMNLTIPLGGIIAVSGYLWFESDWKSNLTGSALETPCLVTHGTQDIDLPISETEPQVRELIQAGLNVDWLEVEKAHDFDGKVELPLVKQWILNQCPSRRKQQSEGFKSLEPSLSREIRV